MTLQETETLSPATGTPGDVARRIEQLRYSAWYTKVGSVVGAAYFFDAFDALTIAVVLPVLIPQWHLTPIEIGVLIAAGNVGQALGSVLFGWLGDALGRVKTSMLTIMLFSALSAACGFAPGYNALLILRVLQGLALGGEVPVMQTYMSEVTPSRFRGRFIVAFQTLFTTGIAFVGLVSIWVVPTFGWQWMFFIGFLPALILAPLRVLMPESPRWLAGQGRYAEADAILRRIEGATIAADPMAEPPAKHAGTRTPSRVQDLFTGHYFWRTMTIWAIWLTVSICSYGLAGWLPSIYRTVLGLSIQQSLLFNFISLLGSIVGCLLCAAVIDRIGRKPWICASLAIGAAALFVLSQAGRMSPTTIMTIMILVFAAITGCVVILGTYTTENFPTHVRSKGVGLANTWQRIAAIIGPVLIGWVLQIGSVGAVFAMLGACAALGSVICLVWGVETKGRALEELAPAKSV